MKVQTLHAQPSEEEVVAVVVVVAVTWSRCIGGDGGSMGFRHEFEPRSPIRGANGGDRGVDIAAEKAEVEGHGAERIRGFVCCRALKGVGKVSTPI